MARTSMFQRSEQATQQSTYYPGLDGLRALAVMAVISYHFMPARFSGGFVGVDLFFVLSGFLITNLLIQEAAHIDRIDLKAFFVRRIRRLLPASLALILVVVLVSSQFGDQLGTRRISQDAITSLFNIANWNFVVSGETYMDQFLGVDPSPLRHMWSLAVEEQFYLLWPLVVAACLHRSRRSSLRNRFEETIFNVAIIGITFSLLFSILLYRGGADLNRIYYGTDVRAQQILVGALSVLVIPRARRFLRATHVQLIATTISLPSFALISLKAEPISPWLYQGGFLGIALIALPLIWICTDDRPTILRSLLSFRPLVAVGRISYGLYLWHWPVHLWVDQESTGLFGVRLLALRTVFTVACALGSWFLFENRIRQQGLRLVRSSLRPWVTLFAIGAVLFAAITIPRTVGKQVSTTTKDGSYSNALDASNAYYRSHLRCDAVRSSESAGDWKVITIGNSLMKEIEPCLNEVLSRQGAVVLNRASNADALCDIERELKNDPLNTNLENTVIVFFHLPFWDRPCGFSIPTRERDAYYRASLDSMIESWIAHGARVLLFAPTPGAETQSVSPLQGHYETLRSSYPNSVTIGDSGRYIRSSDGRYLYNMPCTKVEIGCDENGLIGVRLPVDGQHFCAFRDWQGEPCLLPYAGGERRVATAVAEDIVASIRSSR